MITSVAIGLVFILIGAVLVRSGHGAWASGTADTDEGDTLDSKKQPLRFTTFVVASFAFGFLCIIAGLLLMAASALSRTP